MDFKTKLEELRKKQIKTGQIKISKNGKRYINKEDFPEIFEKLVPNQQWHNKYCKMLVQDDGQYLIKLQRYVANNSAITNKLRYFAKCAGKAVWEETKKMLDRLERIEQNIDKVKNRVGNMSEAWYYWVCSKLSENQIVYGLEANEPSKYLSFCANKL